MAQGNGQVNGRVVHVFDVPPAVAAASGVKEIGFHLLTSDEEIQASRRARKDPMQLAYELTKVSLCEADGKPLSVVDDSIDKFWSGMHPQLRQLAVTGYNMIHSPPDGSTDVFLKSHRERA